MFVKNDPLNAVDPTGFKITVLGNDPALSQALANRDKKLNACNKPRSCKYSMSCEEIADRSRDGQECVNARISTEYECFGGGSPDPR